MIPISTDRPQRKFPWVNGLLIVANIVFYVFAHRVGPYGLLTDGWEKYMLYPKNPQLYQFFTYQFLHQNLSHILFNMVFLYTFGNNLNEKLGHIGYLLFYLTGGVLAGCGQILVSDNATLGASGSISAVTGLFMVLLPRTNIKVLVWFFVYADVWEIPSMYFVLLNIGWDVAEPLLARWRNVQTSNVAHMAHIAGWLAGVFIGLLLLFGKLVQRDHYDLLAMIDRWRRRKQYEALVSRGYDPFRGSRSAERARSAMPAVDPRITPLRDDIHMLNREHKISDAAAKYIELKQIDRAQVLPPQDQLDVANQLMAESRHEQAAEAYEDYLRAYGNTGGQNDQVWLILGLIYARYLPRPDRAREVLGQALERLHDPGQRELAQGELARLRAIPPLPPNTAPG